MFVVDTNILLYAADRSAPEHTTCRNLVLQWREQATPWHLTWGIVYEFLRVATHPRVFRNPLTNTDAWSFIQALLASPPLTVLTETEQHARIAAGVFQANRGISGNLVFDAHTAILMKEHGVATIYTRDSDFHRFSFLTVIDPLQG